MENGVFENLEQARSEIFRARRRLLQSGEITFGFGLQKLARIRDGITNKKWRKQKTVFCLIKLDHLIRQRYQKCVRAGFFCSLFGGLGGNPHFQISF